MDEHSIKYMPGQTPYTKEELKMVRKLYEGALEAEEHYSIDELERAAEAYKLITLEKPDSGMMAYGTKVRIIRANDLYHGSVGYVFGYKPDEVGVYMICHFDEYYSWRSELDIERVQR